MINSTDLHAKMVKIAEDAEAAEVRRNTARTKDGNGRSALYAIASAEADLANSMLRDVETEWRAAVRREQSPPTVDWTKAGPVLIGLFLVTFGAVLLLVFKPHI